MTLRPEIEALVQGALDGSLSPDEQRAFDRLLADDADVRARADELRQLSALLEPLGSVEAPATLAADVLTQIQSVKETRGRLVDFSSSEQVGRTPGARHSVPRGGTAMNKRMIWGLAAAAVLVLAVVGYIASPRVDEGTQATIGTAQRYQAPQIEAKDVAVGDTSVQALMQTETWDAIVKDETLRTLLQDANFRAKLQDAELRKGLQDAELVQALRNPELAKKLADPELAKKLSDAELARKLSDPELARKLADAEFAKKLDDPEVRKKLNDPELLRRLADVDLRTALRSRAFVAALQDADFRARIANADVMAALARPAFQAALRDQGFASALRSPQFNEVMAKWGDLVLKR
jgi:hypothetical protein